MIKLEKLRDVITLMSKRSSHNPKRIEMILSEDGTYYKTYIYDDFEVNGEVVEGYIECKTLPNVISGFSLKYDDSHNGAIFDLIIPEDNNI